MSTVVRCATRRRRPPGPRSCGSSGSGTGTGSLGRATRPRRTRARAAARRRAWRGRTRSGRSRGPGSGAAHAGPWPGRLRPTIAGGRGAEPRRQRRAQRVGRARPRCTRSAGHDAEVAARRRRCSGPARRRSSCSGRTWVWVWLPTVHSPVSTISASCAQVRRRPARSSRGGAVPVHGAADEAGGQVERERQPAVPQQRPGVVVDVPKPSSKVSTTDGRESTRARRVDGLVERDHVLVGEHVDLLGERRRWPGPARPCDPPPTRW